VSCQSIDTHGNIGRAEFIVAVVDTTPPVLALPPAVVVDATRPRAVWGYRAGT
jgi:hypothetical protein